MSNYTLVVFLILIILALVAIYRQVKISFLEGLWSGESKFLIDSGLKDMELYVGSEGNGYLIMVDEQNNFVFNGNVKLYPGLRSINIDYLGGFDGMPENMSLKVDINTGTLSLFDDKKIYACLIKDNKTSLEI